MKRLIRVAAVAVALLGGLTTVPAHASVTPEIPAWVWYNAGNGYMPNPGGNPYGCLPPYNYIGAYWAGSPGNVYVANAAWTCTNLNPPGFTVFEPTGGTWQGFIDSAGNGSGYICYHDIGDYLNYQVWSGVPPAWCMWRSQKAPDGSWWIWNEWEQINHQYICDTAGLQPLISGTSTNGKLALICPEGPAWNQYSLTQEWFIQ